MFYKYNILSLLLLFIDIQNCDNFHCTCYEEAGSEIYFRTCSVLGKTICKLLSMCGSQLTSCFFLTCAMEITIQFEYV